MKFAFRETHLLTILKEYDQLAIRFPLDRFASGYFRSHKAIGSKDRKWIADALYDMIRWRGLLDHLTTSSLTWENRYLVYKDNQWRETINDPSIPMHIRSSFPKAYFQYLCAALGEEKAWPFCLACNGPAPTTVRSNPLKISRDELLQRWLPLYSVSPCLTSSLGILFHKKENFFAFPEFKEGLFEVQDEGSQLVADLMEVKPGDLVLDYCAGSGGKSLAFAHKMEKRGQIYLHDKRNTILQEAKKRLARAGIQNGQLLFFDSPHKAKLKGKMDWVLADVPCSGSGTIRRNPDMKWKFSLPSLEALFQEQRAIFREALSFVRPGGHIVYATCSVFPEENERQSAYFQETLPLHLVRSFQTHPSAGGMDGFFAALFQTSD